MIYNKQFHFVILSAVLFINGCKGVDKSNLRSTHTSTDSPLSTPTYTQPANPRVVNPPAIDTPLPGTQPLGTSLVPQPANPRVVNPPAIDTPLPGTQPLGTSSVPQPKTSINKITSIYGCYPATPNDYISGDFQLSWKANDYSFWSLLRMQSYTGTMQMFNNTTVDLTVTLLACTNYRIIFGKPIKQSYPEIILFVDRNTNKMWNYLSEGRAVPVRIQ